MNKIKEWLVTVLIGLFFIFIFAGVFFLQSFRWGGCS